MNGIRFYAHMDHPLAQHLNDVGKRAARFASAFDAPVHGSIAGLLHDLGKAEAEFQKRLQTNDQEGLREPHAHHGAMLALEMNAWPIAFAINGHHAGLHNRNKLLEKSRIYLPKAKQAVKALFESDPSWSEPEINEKLPKWLEQLDFDPRRTSGGWFAVELFTRVLFSALIDADRLDTEDHERKMDAQRLSSKQYEERWGRTDLRRQWEKFDAERLLAILHSDLRMRFEEAKRNGRVSPEVLAIRREVGDLVTEKAKDARGLFSLTAPTGGGKTLSSMLFALAHAAHHNVPLADDDPHRFRRIIVVIPFLSIIEQTVSELVRVFGDNLVLEHHSQAEESRPRDYKNEKEDGPIDAQAKHHRLAAENWDAPIIVTTSVQFFNSLFSRRPGNARKLHNICQSVVIFDEVQTLPALLLQPLLNVLAELTSQGRPYGCTMLFCTATQPALGQSKELPSGLKSIRPIVEPERAREHFRQLARVEYQWPEDGEKKSWDEIAQEMLSAPAQQALAVVNTRQHARALHQSIKQKLGKRGDGLFHLSTWMMPAHRREVLAEVRHRLEPRDKNQPRCLLVSTQCIEAGVDVDFPEAWRAFGPYDSIVQVAGRCNRNGRAQKGQVHIFRPLDEKYPQGLYQTATAQTELLKKMGLADPHNPESFQDYFRLLYQLSVPDECAIQRERAQFHFEEVDELFEFIEDDTVPVLIRTQRINGLDQDTPARATYDTAEHRGFFIRDDWREFQSFIINIPFHSLSKSQFAQNLMPSFDKDSGLWVWTGNYRGGDDGYGLDFQAIPAEEMIL